MGKYKNRLSKWKFGRSRFDLKRNKFFLNSFAHYHSPFISSLLNGKYFHKSKWKQKHSSNWNERFLGHLMIYCIQVRKCLLFGRNAYECVCVFFILFLIILNKNQTVKIAHSSWDLKEVILVLKHTIPTIYFNYLFYVT